ncbi:MAG: cytochrome C [Hyphomicrobiales bacterium]|nr:MAG: cytochrome C [Hyphomicrobiales bacterium]
MVVAGTASAAVPAIATGADLTPERIAELTEFVRQDCGSCHGMTMKGGLGRPLTKEALADFDEETLNLIILDGIPETAMPPWRPLLSEAEVAWISRALKEGHIE